MEKIFVPYRDDSPAPTIINGHRMLIISSSREQLEEFLDNLGDCELRELVVEEDEAELLAELAETISGGVVVAPPEINVSNMITSLEQELPWIH